MKKAVYNLGMVLIIGLGACSSDNDNEEGYNMNDIVGKWEGYKWADLTIDPNTGEILSENQYVIKNINGLDSTWVEVFYNDGTHQYIDEGGDVPRSKYEVIDKTLYLYSSRVKLHIDELTPRSMKLRTTYELPRGVYVQLIYRKLE